MEFIEVLFNINTYRAAFRIMTPLLLAALGGAFTHYAGILNIALEGQILFGAFFAVAISYYFSSVVAGILAGAIAGVIIGLLFALFVVRFRADEFVVGIAINILAVGGTTFLMRALFGVKASFSDPGIKTLSGIGLSFLPDNGFLSTLLGNYTILTYLSWALIPLLYILFFRTRFGSHLRATGEVPEALTTAGGNIYKIRWIASGACGLFCGLAGSHLALGYLSQFVKNMTAGRGFIALSALLFGGGNPIIIAVASFIFGLAESLSIRYQSLGIPPYFALITPYAVTILALIFISSRRKKALSV